MLSSLRVGSLLPALAAAALALHCAAPGDPAAIAPPPLTAPGRVAIVMYGFFNSENPAAFAPKRIGYALIPDPRPVHGALVAELERTSAPAGARVLSWEETAALSKLVDSDEKRALLRARLNEALAALDRTVQEGSAPAEQLRALQPPFLVPDDWSSADRVLAIVGLETVRRPDPRGLSSILGCFWFDGADGYLGFSGVPYDFTNFGSEDLAATAAQGCLQPGPAAAR